MDTSRFPGHCQARCPVRPQLKHLLFSQGSWEMVGGPGGGVRGAGFGPRRSSASQWAARGSGCSDSIVEPPASFPVAVQAHLPCWGGWWRGFSGLRPGVDGCYCLSVPCPGGWVPPCPRAICGSASGVGRFASARRPGSQIAIRGSVGPWRRGFVNSRPISLFSGSVTGWRAPAPDLGWPAVRVW